MNDNRRTASNERFHASGGADSSDTEQVTSSFALVRALPIPPPAWSRHHVKRKRRTASADSEARKLNISYKMK